MLGFISFTSPINAIVRVIINWLKINGMNVRYEKRVNN